MPAETIHQECTSLQERVSACESLLDVLDGLKYIDGNPVALEDGSGYQLNVVSVTMGENNQWTVKNEEPIVIKHGSKGDDGHTPVVTIKDGNWWIDDVDTGEKAVPADGKDAPTPTFHIWDGVLWYTFAEKPDTSDNGKPTAEDTKGWTSLGNVVGPKGETGEQGPQGPEGIHGLEITRVTDVNDPNYGAVKISYSNGEETVTEYLPTYEMFLELKTKVEDAEENISALMSLATALQTQTFVTGYEFIKENGVIVGCKVSTVKVVLGPDGKTYTTQTGTSEIRPNDLIKLDKDDRGWYWSIPEEDGTASKHYLDAEKTFVPDFEIINGHLYVSLKDGANENNINDAAYWEDLGTVQTILAGHDGEDAEVTPNDPLVSIEQKDGKVIFTFAGSSPIEVPTQTAFAALVGRVTALEQNAATFNSLFNSLKDYEFVKNFEIEKDDKGNTIGFKITFASYTEKYEDGKFVGYDWKIETKTINYKDAGLLSFTVKDGDYYWVLPDGTEIPVDGTFVPEFRINEADGKLYVSLVEEPGEDFSDEDEWKCLGLVTPELAEGDKIIVSVEEEKDDAGEMTGYLVITFRNPSNNDLETLRLPTAEAFKQLQDDVAAANSNIVSLQKAVAALEAYDHVLSFEPMRDPTGRVTIGYHFKFKNSGDVYIYDGKTPSVRINEDGNWEVSYDGTAWEEVKDKNGKPVSAIGIQGENGKTPTFKIDENGEWRISWDGGASWEDKSLGQATGKDGDAFFESVQELDLSRVVIDPLGPNKDATPAYLRIKLTNGKIYEIPTQYAIAELQKQVDHLTSNVSALQQFAEGQTYIVSYEENAEKTGYILKTKKYDATTKTWVESTITIYHGTNGKDGATPTIAIENGYWVINGETTSVKAAGEKGDDGRTPKFKIDENGEWRISWDGGQTWEDQSLGQATGADGDAFFSNILKLDENKYAINADNNNLTKDVAYIKIILAGGDAFIIPTEYTITKLQEQVDQLTSNVSALQQFAEGQTYIVSYEENADKTGYILKTKKYDATTKTWVESTITIYHGTNGTNGATPTITIDENGYWVINDTDTGVKAAGENGKTPLFKIVEGQWYYSYEKTNTTDNEIEGWTKAGQATGDPGTSGDAFFEDVSEIMETITYDTGEKNSEGDPISKTEEKVTYIVIKLVGGGEYKIPTEYEIKRLNYEVRQVNNDVIALQTTVNALESNQHIISYEPYTENGVEVGYKLKLTDGTDEGTDPDVIIIRHGAKGATGDAPEIKIGEDGYWYIGGVKSLKATGENGKTPLFKIVEGQWYYSYEKTNTTDNDIEGWTKAGQATGNPGADGDAFFESVTEVYDLVETDQVAYIEIVLKDKDDDPKNNPTYKIPTEWTINKIERRITEIEKTIESWKTLIDEMDYTFVSDVKEIKQDGNLVGFEISRITVENGKAGQPATSYLFNNTSVVPVKEDGEWYWYIRTLVSGTGEDSKPVYSDHPIKVKVDEVMPIVGYYNGKLYIKIHKDASDKPKLDAEKPNFADLWAEIVTLPTLGEGGSNWISGIENNEKENFVTIEFNDPDVYPPIKLMKYYDMAQIAFDEQSILVQDGQETADVTFTITGSFVTPPVPIATCEGNWTTKGKVTVSGSDGVYNCSVKVKPTSAYEDDDNLGKLTVYVPYYGSTAIGQIDLESEGVGELEVKSLTKEGHETEVTITFRSDEQIAIKNGAMQPLTVKANYETPGNWLSLGKISRTDGGPIQQKINMEQYIVSSKAEPRRCTLAVFTPSGKMINKFVVVQNPKEIILDDYIDLTGENPANCYIITEEGNYKIKLCRGNKINDLITGTLFPRSVFTDNKYNVITTEGIIENYLYFKVNSLEPDAGKVYDGNTIVSVSDGRNTKWSWHLWFCKDGVPGTQKSEGFDMMDRNLGASPDKQNSLFGAAIPSLGLYYQWGRKDPFSEDSKVEQKGTASRQLGIENPDVFYSQWTADMGDWGETKTQHDPCPAGYKVPANDVWKESNNDVYAGESSWWDRVPTFDGEYYLYNRNNPAINYTFGYLKAEDGTRKYIDSDKEFTGEYSGNIQVTGYERYPQEGDVRYVNPGFTLKASEFIGTYWSSAKETSLYYTYIYPQSATLTSGKQEYQKTGDSGWPFYSPVREWVAVDNTEPYQTTTKEELQNYRSLTNGTQYNREYDGLSAANGLQVRCVKE